MDAALVADSLSKRYGDTRALADVSLSVGAGEIFALVGPNGAGKTTLVRTLTGTSNPDSGTVALFGESPDAVDEARIGLLPQSFSPPDRLTARELLSYYAGLYDDPQPVDGVLADVGLTEDDDTWYANLSGGQQRRVCVGIALVNDPDLLFLDEPTTGIDPAGRRALWSLVGSLAEGGTTVFLTTHYLEEAEELADRVALLDDGAIAETGSPASLVDSYGGGTSLLVQTDAPTDAVAELEYETAETDGGVRVLDVAPTDIGEVVADLERSGVAYDALTWSEPTLEDVYLHLTGGRVSAARQPSGAVATAGESR